jgi:hypothetical protein
LIVRTLMGERSLSKTDHDREAEMFAKKCIPCQTGSLGQEEYNRAQGPQRPQWERSQESGVDRANTQ